MSSPAEHPQIISFSRALAAGQVERHVADNFDRWRRGPKCNADPELRAAADELWERMLSAGGPRPHPPPPAPAERSARSRAVDAARGQAEASAAGMAPASVLEHPFHNPYTFLPFGQAPKRHLPTPLSADEHERDRFTGIIELDIVTLSPLLTCSPVPTDQKADHKQYSALTIGDDVIVPATGIRGALRTLLTILTGGTLGYLDEELWLCQGRDLNLGPAGKNSPPTTPQAVFLAEVVSPGSTTRSGSLRLGQTRLVQTEQLKSAPRPGRRPLRRPESGKGGYHYFTDDRCSQLTDKADGTHRWHVKLSGRPVNPRGKREGLFLPDGPILNEVPASLWSAYQGRNVHGDHPELRKGDLVWLEPKPGRTTIASADDIASIQWARWGRQGERLLDLVGRKHPEVLPDSINPDGRGMR